MEVLRASAMGFCFGVRDALAAALAVAEPHRVTIHGELVHNEAVHALLAGRGFRTVAEDRRAAALPATEQVLITAHGISDRERGRLLAGGKTLLDTTCPLVRKAHAAAVQLAAEGYHVLVLGKRGHVEVRGLTEDLPGFDVIGGLEDVRTFPHARLGIVCQTTVPIAQARALAQEIRCRNRHADVRFLDTVCEPTKQRIAAVEALLGRVDAMVVVGGRNSNNTAKLVELCARAGLPVVHVNAAAELDPAAFTGCRRVGLTAGTSTLDASIEEVHAALLALQPGHVPTGAALGPAAARDPRCAG